MMDRYEQVIAFRLIGRFMSSTTEFPCRDPFKNIDCWMEQHYESLRDVSKAYTAEQVCMIIDTRTTSIF